VLSRHREGELIENLVQNWDGRGGLRLNLGPHESLVHDRCPLGVACASLCCRRAQRNSALPTHCWATPSGSLPLAPPTPPRRSGGSA